MARNSRSKNSKNESHSKTIETTKPDKHHSSTEFEQLQTHFTALPEFSRLQQKTQAEFLKWLLRSRPFEGRKHLAQELKNATIKGLSTHIQKRIVDSLRLQLTRRPFLASLGTASTASLAAGLTSVVSETLNTPPNSKAPTKELVSAIEERETTVGQAVLFYVQQSSTRKFNKLSRFSQWENFLHSLDMSNWMEAAAYLKDSSFRNSLEVTLSKTTYSALFPALNGLRLAWEFLTETKSLWERKYFVAYAFGKMAALSKSSPQQPTFPNYAPEAKAHILTIHRLAPLFQSLEILNQRFQVPGKSQYDAPIRVTQGHNFSFSHFSRDLRNPTLFSPKQKTVLVNWDAHADLSDPFDNPRMPLNSSFEVLSKAISNAELVNAASYMSIAGWILPLLYQHSQNFAGKDIRIIWVAPKEAYESSRNYMESYGDYSIIVGDWLLPHSLDQIAKLSTQVVGDWNLPGTKEIRRYSDKKTLSSITSPHLLNNQKTCRISIVDPEDKSRLQELLADSQIALSIDSDYSGTREPGIRPRKGYLPHYPLTGNATEQARHKQLLNLLSEFVQQYSEQVQSISIAHSPNFTAAEELRRPVSKILKIVTNDDLQDQPEWIEKEIKHTTLRIDDSPSNLLDNILTAGGLAGLSLTAGLLSRDWQKVQAIRNILFYKAT